MHAIIIIRSVQLNQANELAEAQGWGPNNFSIGLNASGSMDDPATHYWCAPEVTDAGWATIQQLLAAFPGAVAERYDADTQPNFPWEKLAQMDLKVMQSPMEMP